MTKQYKMKKVSSLIIVILLVACFALWHTSRSNSAYYEQREKELKAQFDSLKALQHETDLHAIKALTELETAKRDLAGQSHLAEKYKLRYEAMRSIKPVNLSDAQIDSAIRRLYPIR